MWLHAALALLALAPVAVVGASECNREPACGAGELVNHPHADERACYRPLRATEESQKVRVSCGGCGCASNHTWYIVYNADSVSDNDDDPRVTFGLTITSVDLPPGSSLRVIGWYRRRWRTVQSFAVKDLSTETRIARYAEEMALVLETPEDAPFTFHFEYAFSGERGIPMRTILTIALAAAFVITIMIVVWRGSKTAAAARRLDVRSKGCMQFIVWCIFPSALRADAAAQKEAERNKELQAARLALAKAVHGTVETLGLSADRRTALEGEQCAVCLDDLLPLVEASATDVEEARRRPHDGHSRDEAGGRELSAELSILPCGHAFHRACVEGWFVHQKNTVRRCPLCKDDPLGSDGESAKADTDAAAADTERSAPTASDTDTVEGAGGQQAAGVAADAEAVTERGDADPEAQASEARDRESAPAADDDADAHSGISMPTVIVEH
mmetsp:Transcript_754/g.2113  ORF Transcript_754/g.2113 Transcript_754/m.2113 type:complete len:444 (-) Transcript_754:116-1447(-)